MIKREEGITLIALITTIIIMIIIAGITLGSIKSKDGSIQQANEAKEQGERESIIEKIEADLFNEKIKTGKTPDRAKLIEIITNKGYGTVSGDNLTTKEGSYIIPLSEILNWED